MITPAATDDYRFIHLSDPHLSIPRIHSYRDLLNKRLLGYLSWLKSRRKKHQQHILKSLLNGLDNTDFDQLVITGDLTHLGLPDEFQQVLDWLKPIADRKQITLVPGNHDAYARSDWTQTFSLWEDYMAPDFSARPRIKPFPSLRVRGSVAFIGLTSALPTSPLLATGTIDPEQLSSLPNILDDTAALGLFRVILLHHAPQSRLREWRKRLTNTSELKQILQKHGAEMILHGHTHQSSCHWLQVNDRSTAVQIPVIGAASASATSNRKGSRASYNHFLLQSHRDIWNIKFRIDTYQPVSRDFEPGKETVITIPHSTSNGKPR